MALPSNTAVMAQQIDPVDVVDFSVSITQGDGDAILQTGEDIASFTLIPTAEAIAAGLLLLNTASYFTTLTGLDLHFWISIDPSMAASTIFSGSGTTLGLELTIVTTSDPSRTYQRTIAIPVAQQ